MVESTPAESNTPAPVTVVIPVYNLSRYLTDTVTSVVSQSYAGPTSVLILDDGSSDESLAVARSLAEQHESIRVESQQNQGRAATRNRLLELAETELIAWLDGDDVASPHWLEEQVSYLIQRPNCVAVSGQGYSMTADGFAIGPILHPLEAEEIDRQHSSGQANVFFQSCVTVRKSAVVKAGAYDLRYPCAEDYSLWLRLGELGKLANVDAFHLYYRVHSTSANWTANIEQRTQGHAILNEARIRRGLEPLAESPEALPPPRKDDWNRRLYWINIALKAGNPRSALQMLRTAIVKHPTSLLMWILLFVSLVDVILFRGNTIERLTPGVMIRPPADSLPYVSCYRFGRALNRVRRRFMKKC